MVAKFEDPASASKRARLRAVAPSEPAAKRGGSADTLPPMPLKSLLSAGGANLYVLSADAELIDTVQRAGGEQYPVFDVRSYVELETAIAAHQCGIALLDADLLGAQLLARIAKLDQYSSRLVILVAADRTAAQGLMGLLSERKIHRLLMKPAALGITRLLVESGVNRCIVLREAAAAQADERAPAVARARPGTRIPAWVLASATAALLVGVGTIASLSDWLRPAPTDDVAMETAALGPPAAAPPVAGEATRFEALLTAADTAFREGRLTAPAGDNALDHTLAILAADPTEPTARQQLARVSDALFAQAEAALLADDRAGAAAALAHVRRADPASARLAFLEAQLERARAATAAAATPAVRAPAPAAAPPVAADPARAELASLLTIAKARLERGALLAPAGDSAAEYVDRAARLAAGDEEVVALRAALAAELVAAARRALADMDFAGAAAAVGQARRFGAEAGVLRELGAEVATARAARAAQQHSEWLALAERRRATGALIAPADDSAQHYLDRLQSEAPSFAGLEASWQAWRAAVAAAASGLIAARNWDGAEAQLAALEQAPQGGALAAPLRADLEHGRLQEQYLATAIPASELTLVRGAAPTYPPDAEQRGIEGWVELEFVVDVTGRTKDLKVTAAEPPGRFETVALAAVAQYRFAPFERDGRAFERRVRVRVRFTLR
jgi:TonB family protein